MFGAVAIADNQFAPQWLPLHPVACHANTRVRSILRANETKSKALFGTVYSSLITIARDVFHSTNSEELDAGIEKTLSAGNHITFCEAGIRFLVGSGFQGYKAANTTKCGLHNTASLLSTSENRSLLCQIAKIEYQIFKCSGKILTGVSNELILSALENAKKDPLGFVYDIEIPVEISDRLYDGFASSACALAILGSLVDNERITAKEYRPVLEKLLSTSRSYLGLLAAMLKTDEFRQYLHEEDVVDLEQIKALEPARNERIAFLKSISVDHTKAEFVDREVSVPS